MSKGAELNKMACDKFNLNSVERYYSYMSQGNCFAPKFSELRADAQKYWIDKFNAYSNH